MSEQAGRERLSIFDDAATGGFHVRSRGYDRDQVERYVRKLEDQLNAAAARGSERGQLLKQAEDRIAEMTAEMRAVKSRLNDAEERLRNSEQPTFAGLGDHVATLLKSAEEQSETLVRTATADVERLRAEAAADADKTRTQAQAYSDATRSDADEYSMTVHADADAYSQQTRDEADAYSQQTRDEADTYSTTTRADADTYSTTTRADAEAAAATARREASEDATAARVAAVDEAKAMLAEVAAAVTAIRTDADRDADEQREAAATLLHEARKRADHSMGAISAALADVGARLSGGGLGGHAVEVAGDETTTPAAVPAPSLSGAAPGDVPSSAARGAAAATPSDAADAASQSGDASDVDSNAHVDANTDDDATQLMAAVDER